MDSFQSCTPQTIFKRFSGNQSSLQDHFVFTRSIESKREHHDITLRGGEIFTTRDPSGTSATSVRHRRRQSEL